MFEPRDGLSCGDKELLFVGIERLALRLARDDRSGILEPFMRFREITRVEGDDYWNKCLAVLRRVGGVQMRFEVEDW